MDKLPIILFSLAFLVIAAVATTIPALRRLKQNRAKRFKAICEDWLKDINLAAADPNCNTGGSDLFPASDAIYEHAFGNGWLVCYPLVKSYPDLGLTVQVHLIIHVPSLVPDASGAINTVFVNIAEPTPRWWHSRDRLSVFPKVTSLLYASKGRERTFTYSSVLDGTLVSAQ